MRRVLFFILWFGILSGVYASDKPSIVVTTYPIYEVVKQVGGDTIKLDKVLPYGVDVHTFHPSPKTMALMSRATLFIFNGAGLEPWSEQLLTNVSSSVQVLDMSHAVTLLPSQVDNNHKEHHEISTKDRQNHDEEHGHDHHDHTACSSHEGHGPMDPHYWLSPFNMIRMVEKSVDYLSVLQPKYVKQYRKNADQYIQKLKALDTAYKEGLSSCKHHLLVSNHAAFEYLASAYGLQTVSVTGLSPEHRPSAKVMAKTIDLVEKEKIQTIFFEAYVNDDVTQAIARETGVDIESLQPLANLDVNEVASNANYITIMRDNLTKIINALECH